MNEAGGAHRTGLADPTAAGPRVFYRRIRAPGQMTSRGRRARAVVNFLLNLLVLLLILTSWGIGFAAGTFNVRRELFAIIIVFFIVRSWRLVHRVRSGWRSWRSRTFEVLRMRRLQWMVLRGDAPARVPHRFVEYLLRRGYRDRDLVPALPHFRPGTVLVLSDHDPPVGYSALASELFEPIDVRKAMDVPAYGDQSIRQLMQQGGVSDPSSIDFGRLFRSGFGVVLAALAITVFVRGIVLMLIGVSQQNVVASVILPLLMLYYLMPYVSQFVRSRRWWLIPGGLASRTETVFGASDLLHRFNAGTGPLLLDARIGRGMVWDGTTLCEFTYPVLATCLLVDAWQCVARPPTDQELESAFGATLAGVQIPAPAAPATAAAAHPPLALAPATEGTSAPPAQE